MINDKRDIGFNDYGQKMNTLIYSANTPTASLLAYAKYVCFC